MSIFVRGFVVAGLAVVALSGCSSSGSPSPSVSGSSGSDLVRYRLSHDYGVVVPSATPVPVASGSGVASGSFGASVDGIDALCFAVTSTDAQILTTVDCDNTSVADRRVAVRSEVAKWVWKKYRLLAVSVDKLPSAPGTSSSNVVFVNRAGKRFKCSVGWLSGTDVLASCSPVRRPVR